MPTLRIGDASIHYRESGAGNDVVLLLHAFPLHSEMWAPQLAFLAARFRVVAPDYRGLGQSREAPPASTMELLADDVVAVCRQLGIRRAAVAGLSMGGYLALEVYRRAPGLVRGLALCCTRATPDTEATKAAREKQAHDVLAKGLDWATGEYGAKLQRPDKDPEVDATVSGLIRGGTREGVAAALRGMALRPDSVPTLPLIRCPTVVITGEDDQLIPPAESQRMAQTVKGARLVRIPQAGHLANLENPSAFNTALSTFFASLPA